MKKWLLVTLAVTFILGTVLYIGRPDAKIHISFLNVGQGDAILIQQGSIEILIDGGPSPQAVTNELGQRLPYWDRTIELVVLTHFHQDHLAGLVEVCKRYQISTVLQPGFAIGGDENALVTTWQELLLAKQPNVIIAETGQEILLGGVTITINNPQGSFLDGNPDPDNALVLNVKAGEFDFLLTSDIDREVELDLLYNRCVTECDVLQVAHHGSGLSTANEFLNVVRPELAVISVGANEFGHPSREVLERLRGTHVYRTDVSGTIEFVTDGNGLWLQTDR